LILGKIYVDHGGVMRVRCLTGAGDRGLAARLRFKESGMFERDPRQVRRKGNGKKGWNDEYDGK
jgi:hypothetical protein